MINKPKKQRTLFQNNAFHLWVDELSTESNNRGLTLKVLIENLNVDVTPESIKNIAQKIGEVKYGKVKSRDWNTDEMTNVCKEVDMIFLSKGIKIDFPCFEDKNFNEHYDTIR